MPCSQCSTENQSGTSVCQKCGQAISGVTAQKKPGKPSKSAIATIWNPNAAVYWSLLFSPAFGSYLQMLNWRALGEPEKAETSQNWFHVSLGMLFVYFLMGRFAADSYVTDIAIRVTSFIILLVWYFSVGGDQSTYVNEKLGSSYTRKPWSKVVLIGVAGYVVVMANYVTLLAFMFLVFFNGTILVGGNLKELVRHPSQE